MRRFTAFVGAISLSSLAFAGQVTYDSIYDKFPLPDATYTANGEYFQLTNPEGNLRGLEPPFTLRAVPITTNESPAKPLYLIRLRLDMCQVDENGLPLESGDTFFNEFNIVQDADSDLAYLQYNADGTEIGPVNLNESIHDIEACSIDVAANGAQTLIIKVSGEDDPIEVITLPAPIADSVLSFWQVAPYNTIWLDTVTLSGPNVIDRNGGEDVYKFRDSNGDGETNAADIQFVINAVLGVNK